MSGNGGNRALELLRSLPRVSLANLRPNPGSKKRVSACSLPRGPWRQDCASAAGAPGPGVVRPRGCQKDIIPAGPGERPGQNRRGKAKEWMALLCVLARCLPFACLVADVCGHPRREVADEWCWLNLRAIAGAGGEWSKVFNSTC